jgi:hypothetical protein
VAPAHRLLVFVYKDRLVLGSTLKHCNLSFPPLFVVHCSMWIPGADRGEYSRDRWPSLFFSSMFRQQSASEDPIFFPIVFNAWFPFKYIENAQTCFLPGKQKKLLCLNHRVQIFYYVVWAMPGYRRKKTATAKP